MIISKAQFAGSSTKVAGKPSLKLPEFAFIGRSNVGKSSLINMLTGNNKLALTSSKPGKTRLVNHFLINDSWYLVDLPGYGYAKMSKNEKETLHSVIKEYLNYSKELVLLFVLIDSRHEVQKVDLDFINELGENNIPFAIIFTKGDKLGPVALEKQLTNYKKKLLEYWEELPVSFKSSSETGMGREEILSYIENVLTTIKRDKNF